MLCLLIFSLMVKLVFSQGVGLEEAGIVKNIDSSYAIKFHSRPEAYLGWKALPWFWSDRNLSTGDPKDVPITNRTYRLIWAIGPLDKNNDIDYHTYKPKKDYEYKYINFLAPELTEVPEFHDRVKKKPSSAAATQMSLVSLLLLSNALALLVTAVGGVTVQLAATGLLW